MGRSFQVLLYHRSGFDRAAWSRVLRGRTYQVIRRCRHTTGPGIVGYRPSVWLSPAVLTGEPLGAEITRCPGSATPPDCRSDPVPPLHLPRVCGCQINFSQMGIFYITPPARVRVPGRFLPNGNFRHHTSRACAGARPRRGDGRPDGGAAPRRPRRDPPGRSSWSKASGGAGRVRHGSGRGIPIRGNQGIPIRGPDPRAAPGIENASSRKCGRSRAGVKTGFCSRVPGARVRCFPGRPGSSSGPLRGVSKPVKFAGGVRLQDRSIS